jgi:hypothetical protein
VTVLLDKQGGVATGWTPSWSPDGLTLLIGKGEQDAEGAATALFRIADRDFHWLPINDASEAAWAPDGRSILASTLTQERTRILLATPAGKVLRTLASGGCYSGPPGVAGGRFSSDGRWLSYTLGSGAIWLMSKEGGRRHFLTYGSSAVWR